MSLIVLSVLSRIIPILELKCIVLSQQLYPMATQLTAQWLFAHSTSGIWTGLSLWRSVVYTHPSRYMRKSLLLTEWTKDEPAMKLPVWLYIPSRVVVTMGGVVKPHPVMSTKRRRAPGFPDHVVLPFPVFPAQVMAHGGGLESPLGESMMGLGWIVGRRQR